MMNELVLKAEAVGKCYGTFRALEGIDMELTPGIYGLLGPNGAGKSTMMNILSGLIEPSEGQVLFNGKEIGKMGKEYRAVLGIVPQQQRMYEFFTGYEFLAYMAALKGIPNAIARERIGQLLERVELSGAAGKKLGAYSGGMKQRRLLAQALLNDPAVLLLDEPTAGLDPRQRIVLRNLIAGLGLEKILIFATHVVSDIESIAKEILLLKNGRLICQGTVAELCEPLEGRVVEILVSAEEMEHLEGRGRIVSFLQVKDGIRVRLLLEGTDLPEGAHVTDATLEEVFLDRFGTDGWESGDGG